MVTTRKTQGNTEHANLPQVKYVWHPSSTTDKRLRHPILLHRSQKNFTRSKRNKTKTIFSTFILKKRMLALLLSVAVGMGGIHFSIMPTLLLTLHVINISRSSPFQCFLGSLLKPLLVISFPNFYAYAFLFLS